MPKLLLPSSAAAFAPREPPIVVLDTKISWLMATLKRLSQPRLCLRSPLRQKNRLMEIMSPESAVWTLCSVLSSNATGMGPQNDESPQAEGPLNVPPIQIMAYVVYVDLVLQNEVAFKLTPETIDALVKRQSAHTAAYTLAGRGSQAQLDVLQKQFVEAANKFTYRTNAMYLEGLKMDGTRELPHDSREAAKAEILRLYVPSMPSPCMAPMTHSVFSLPGVATPWTPKPVYSSGFVNSWSTESTIPTSSASNHYNPTPRVTLDVGPTRYFSMDFASSQVPISIPDPQSTTYLPSHFQIYH
jgi:hypothetical protein